MIFAAGLLCASVANAGYLSKDETTTPKYSVSGFWGVATYVMTDLNALIDAGNENAGARLVYPIEKGTEYGFRVEVNINRHWLVGLSYSAFLIDQTDDHMNNLSVSLGR